MKKLLVLLTAFALVVAFTAPAMAIDHVFGGYWRTRAYMQKNFTGEDDTGAKDLSQVDTRTRVYYTAKFSDNFKFVNKFELDAVWGGEEDPAKGWDSQYGDIGTDGVRVEVKNSYADFGLGNWNFKLGAQGVVLARGFLFDDDCAGAVVTYNAEGFSLPFLWIKPYEGGAGKDANDQDVDYYAFAPSFNLGESATIKPTLVSATSKDGSAWAKLAALGTVPGDNVGVYIIGFDLDAKLDFGTVWLSAYLENGEIGDYDVSAWLIGAGSSMKMGPAGFHAQILYATGDDDATDEDINAFTVPAGNCYYWAEIMGYGTFDNQVSSGSPADNISNLMAFNIGASFNPIEKLTATIDLWYASLVEDDANGEDKLGTELDIKFTYKLLPNLNLDVVGAYLFAGDATWDGDDDANPYEVGTRLSLSF
ncbi:MAG: alginate export family protein [Desulfobacteraceae bacterium]|nr:alginate export family protein [Desulfobacteraceae bacterium]